MAANDIDIYSISTPRGRGLIGLIAHARLSFHVINFLVFHLVPLVGLVNAPSHRSLSLPLRQLVNPWLQLTSTYVCKISFLE